MLDEKQSDAMKPVGQSLKREILMAKKAIEPANFNPIRQAHDAGLRSNHAYILGFASIGLSLVAWLVSRSRSRDDKAQSDRWGIFIGHWAPTFFAVGLALKNEE